MRAPLALLLVLALPASAAAQGLDLTGLDLTEPAPAKPARPAARPKPAPKAAPAKKPAADPLGLDLSGESTPEVALDPSVPVADRVVAVPPRRPDGRPDLEAYPLLHAALAEKLEGRLVPQGATLQAIERLRLRGAALASADGLARLARALPAGRLVAFDLFPKKLQARVFAAPGAAPGADLSFPLPRKLDAGRAGTIVAGLVASAREPLGLPAPPPALRVVEASVPAGPSDVALETQRETVTEEAAAAMRAPFAVVLAGAGTSLRSLKARTDRPIVPQAQGAMASLGFDLSVYPLRLVPSLAKGPLSDLVVEGHYRRTITGASLRGGALDGSSCKVDDDELVARVGYRYPLGAGLPRLGVGVGWTSDRALFRCDAPALSTRYRSWELHLRALQPILGEQLTVELEGGPNILISPRAQGHFDRAFSLEGWITGRPIDLLYVRGGARFSNTRLTTVPDGVAVTDLRTFIGIELGAAL